MINQVLAGLLALAVCACNQTAGESINVLQPVAFNQSAVAGIGDTILDLERTRPLPNVFGKPDIFGRRTPSGRVVVRYAGIKDGKAVLVRQDLTIELNESTMSRTPLFIPTSSTTTTTGNIGPYAVSGRSTTEGYTVLPPIRSQTNVMAGPMLPIFAGAGEEIPIGGRIIIVNRIAGNSIEYTVR